MAKLTIGEFRLGVNFNPSTKPEVDEVKQNAAQIITNLIKRAEAEDASTELSRTCKMSASDFETATMLAVKAMTTDYEADQDPEHIGEFRVALRFNPSANELVNEFKTGTAELINKVELKLRKRYHPFQLNTRQNSEFHRHCSMASTFFELGGMYATKASVLEYTQCPDKSDNEKELAIMEDRGKDVMSSPPAEFHDDTNSE